MEDLAHAGVRFLVAAGEQRVSGRRRLAVMFDIDDTLIEYSGRVIQPIVELAKLSKRLDFRRRHYHRASTYSRNHALDGDAT